MGNTNPDKSFVESVIDSMVQGKLNSEDAVNTLLGSEEQGSDIVTFDEGEDITCPQCGSSDFDEGFAESEDGSEVPALKCKNCGCGLIEQLEDTGDAGLVEAEIDENDPHCPACGSDDLSAEMIEGEAGEEDMVLHCGSCKATMVVAD